MKASARPEFLGDTLREKVSFLFGAPHAQGASNTVEVIETHFAWVFLAGDRAYKLKKAMRQGSMDYRTVAQRERACREELRLNRRLAPGVYLRVLPVRCARAASSRRGAAAETIDWLIEMRRLPVERMLDRAIAQGTVGERDLGRAMRALASFFATARRQPMSDRAYVSRLRRQIGVNARELLASDLKLSHPRVREVEALQFRFLTEQSEVLAGRGAHLIEGHGDLRPEHVFLGVPSASEPLMRRACVIDCLEFDPDLRRLDPAEEIAFLALECQRLGAVTLADAFIGRYRAATGDVAPQVLFDFYRSRRAAVRAQIAAWHLRDETFAGEGRIWRGQAHEYLREALHHIEQALMLARARVRVQRYG